MNFSLSRYAVVCLMLAAGSAGHCASNQDNPVGSAVVTANPLMVVLGLATIVALILMLAWLTKRLTGISALNGQAIKILAVTSVGQRERVMIIEAGGEQFLIGVAPGSVNPIHHFPEPVITANSPKAGDFQQKIQQLLRQDAKP